jgi:hypothetical protein
VIDNLLAAMPAILAAARTKRVRETGEIAVEGSAIRHAAQAIGYEEPFSQHELGEAMRTIGAQKYNAPRGAKYAFPGAMQVGDAISRAVKSVRTLNHLSGPICHARLVASETYPLGFELSQLADDYVALPDDLTTIPIALLDVGATTTRIRYTRGAALALRVEPGSSEDRNLAFLRSPTYDLRMGAKVAPDRITLEVVYPCGTKVVFGHGAFLCSERYDVSSVYTFFFADVIKESD